jgi:hypothetical protein
VLDRMRLGVFNDRLAAIATAPRETGRPLLLYPFPFPRGSAEQIETLRQSHENSPALDLGDPAVRRMIKLAKRRGYVTYDVLNGFMPSDKFSPDQIKDVIDQLCEIAINVVDSQERQEKVSPRATAKRKELPEGQPEAPARDANLFGASWAVYGIVYEGYWDGTKWLSAGGVPCDPTHWMPLPSLPLVLAQR